MLINPKTNRRALWRYALVLPVAAFLLMCSQKDPVQTEPTITGEVFLLADQNPEPKGGIAGLGDYLSQNLKYPAAAQKAGITGKVFISFVVTTEGRIADVQILKGLGFGCDEEAVRVVKQMPNWTPGRQDGKPVNVKFNLPIRFDLNDSDPAAKAADSGKKDAFVRERFDHFYVDGEEVPYATFKQLWNGKVKTIKTDPANRRMDIITR